MNNHDKKKSGFEDDPFYPKPICHHPEHNAPMHIYIPEGKIYRHICPACGKETVLRPRHSSLEWQYQGPSPAQEWKNRESIFRGSSLVIERQNEPTKLLRDILSDLNL